MNCVGEKLRDDCCNTKFTCDDSIFEKHSEKCHYKGKLYNHNEKIDASLLPSCVPEAKCVASANGPKFEYVHVDPMPLESGCVYKYTIDNMCNPSKKVCDTAEKAKLIECHVSGKVHHEGELFTPNFSAYFSSGCYQCVCDANYSNMTLPKENKNCRKLDCGMVLFHAEKLRDGCIPVYHSNTQYDVEPTKCCPIDFECRKSINQF